MGVNWHKKYQNQKDADEYSAPNWSFLGFDFDHWLGLF
ncbi:hypothetical protein ADIS_4661 [Lunatimonas lonarensis]|uniref:Uncharacterized protein n=1 Tax=Lunatimonas lonarensis TaxID=1232681 RepID=R7ZLM0_9BACT|nr:hypothetical protein ADIS_4661 [Lunatimonas lonarensis]